jgi:diguanylate cyclase (GGDEF)-like protein
MRTIGGVARGCLIALLFAACVKTHEGGRVAVDTYRTRDLEALGAKNGPQNFAVAEDSRGVIYLANNLGLIELDGRSARLIPLPGKVSPLSLGLDRNGRMWVGASGDLGYLDADAQGRTIFVSLLGKLPAGERDFGDLWQTSVTTAGIYFRSPTHLLRWNGRSMRIWKAPNGFHIGNVVGDRLIVRQTGIGLSTVDGDRLHLLPGGERFAEEKVFVILPYGDGRLLLIGRASGAMLFDPAGRQPLETLATPANDFFTTMQAYHGCVLADGTFAITSVRGGVAVINRSGDLLARFDKKRGLNDDMAFYAFASRDRRLWLGLNYGVSVLDVPAVVTRHSNEGETGLEGFVESIARHHGRLYASTGRGIYQMPAAPAGEEPHFGVLPGTATQSYKLLSAGDTLLAATRDGVLEIVDDGKGGEKAVTIQPEFAYSLAPVAGDPERILVAFDRGAGVLEKIDGVWKLTARAEQAGHAVVEILDAGGGEVWAGTESDGLFKLRLDGRGASTRLTLEKRFDSAAGLPEGWAYPNLVDGRLAFGTPDGIYRFVRERNRFEPDPAFASALGKRPAFRIEAGGENTLWLVSDNEALRLDRTAAGWKQTPTGIRTIGGGDRILSFLIENDVLWIGGDRGLFRYEPSKDVMPPAPRALIREVRLGDGTLFFGGAYSDGRGVVDRQTHGFPPIAHEKNSIRFNFAGGGRSDLDLSYRLEGFDSEWSGWSREPWKEYTNLPGGDYVFRVRARDRYSQTGPAAALAFRVLRPWYLTLWAIAAFIAAGVLLVLLIVRIRGAHLRRKNRELQQIIDTKTAALREASYTDPLTSLRNRRYFAEVTTHEAAGQRQSLLLLVDLDSFKGVNDQYGHAAGDAVLVETARRLAEVAARDAELLFRWGGEEFLLIAGGRGAAEGPELAKRLLEIIAATPFNAGGTEVWLTASIGWAPYPLFLRSPAAAGIEAVLDLADRAMYQAKASGRNRAVGFVPRADVSVREEVAIAPMEETWGTWVTTVISDQ